MQIWFLVQRCKSSWGVLLAAWVSTHARRPVRCYDASAAEGSTPVPKVLGSVLNRVHAKTHPETCRWKSCPGHMY